MDPRINLNVVIQLRTPDVAARVFTGKHQHQTSKFTIGVILMTGHTQGRYSGVNKFGPLEDRIRYIKLNKFFELGACRAESLSETG